MGAQGPSPTGSALNGGHSSGRLQGPLRSNELVALPRRPSTPLPDTPPVVVRFAVPGVLSVPFGYGVLVRHQPSACWIGLQHCRQTCHAVSCSFISSWSSDWTIFCCCEAPRPFRDLNFLIVLSAKYNRITAAR